MSTRLYQEKVSLFIISVYLILGNIPRIIHLPTLSDNVVITEFILYVALIIFALFNKIIHLSLSRVWVISFIIILSFCYGVIINDLDLKATLYSIRLILILLSANIAGYIMFKVYKTDLIKSLNFIINTYVALLMVGIIIYMIFPNSVNLWVFLSQYGISFSGDPHEDRLVSSYFDPNFYGAIILIPLILCAFLYKETRKKKFMILSILFSVSLAYSYSRSGIAAALIFLFIVFIKNGFFLTRKIKLGSLITIWFSSIIVGIMFYVNIDRFQRIFDRFSNISYDGSALARLQSFNLGLNIFNDRPIFGVGYNYLPSVDSSLLSILANFGIIFTSILIIMFSSYVIKTRSRLKLYFDNSSQYLRLYDLFIIYIFVSAVFTSQFNNLIFYQFWLFPCIMIGSYISYLSQNHLGKTDNVLMEV